MKASRTLGILGGLGAAAGLRLAEYIVATAQLKNPKRDSEFPRFILYNLPAEGMDENGVADTSVLELELIAALERLEGASCDVVVIACNSAHVIFERLPSHFSGEILNMVECCCQEVAGISPIGVLCSDSSKSVGLYEDRLKTTGVTVIKTTKQEQRLINGVIADAIAGLQTAKDARCVQSVMEAMMARGAKKIIVGCTEIPLVMRHGSLTVPFVDAGLVTVDKALALLNAP